MEIHQSTEDYLEAILMIQERKGYVRSVDVSNQLGVSKPSVSYTTKKLRESNYIAFNEDGMITLTESGRLIAEKTFAKHKLFTDLFKYLGVPDEIAAEDACRIEHVLSPETFDTICKYINSTGLDLSKSLEA